MELGNPLVSFGFGGVFFSNKGDEKRKKEGAGAQL